MGRLFDDLLAGPTSAPPATPATPATFGGTDVPRVAESQESQGGQPVKATPMTAEEEQAIRAWLIHIDEDDPAIIAEVLDKCRDNPEARAYFLGRSEEVPPPDPDDRRTCHACRHLRGGQCASRRHGIEGEASHRFRPHPDLPRRCAGFVEVSR